MSVPSWLIENPVAHRGLHDKSGGIIENTISAFEAAIGRSFTIETDLQCTSDNEAVIFHDPVLERLTDAKGLLRDLSADQFKKISYRDTGDHMLDLPGLLDLVAGRTPLMIEIKSRGDFNPDFAAHIAAILKNYTGEYAVMSFDPRMLKAMRGLLPHIPRGLTSSGFDKADWPGIPAMTRFKLRHLYYAWHTRPHFIAYSINALPAPAPLLMKAAGTPLLAWTINSAEKLAKARRWADNIIFEGIDPDLHQNGHVSGKLHAS